MRDMYVCMYRKKNIKIKNENCFELKINQEEQDSHFIPLTQRPFISLRSGATQGAANKEIVSLQFEWTTIMLNCMGST